jgi:phosphate transport system substrate-binding protein
MGKLNRILGSLGLSAALLFTSAIYAGDITGAGATFPYPIYAKWAEAYKAKTGTGMHYQSIGSLGGIKQIQAKTVDFCATNAPLNEVELEQTGLTQFPSVIGGVVPVINVAGVAPGQLKLDGKVLADIFLGRITRWNDPRIVADNDDVALPDEAITVVHHTDGSGTTFIFTAYLSQVSLDWKRSVGSDKSVVWPVGTGGKGNDGVASYVQRIKYSIGYVEYTYSLQNKLSYVQMKNHDGQFIKPEIGSFRAAAANAHWDTSTGFYEILTNEPGKDSWPITGATYILISKTQNKPESAMNMLRFFDWTFSNGDKMASDLDYVPLPPNLKTMIRDAWMAQVKDTSGNVLWK